ncbi:MAG: hypothetical protein QXF28_07380 [Nitrososphaerota archaeon]
MRRRIQLYLFTAGSSLRDICGRYCLTYASRCRSMMNALTFMRRVLNSCDGRPVVVVDRGPWYPWTLKRLEIEYIHETFRNRNKVEGWFRELKDRTGDSTKT